MHGRGAGRHVGNRDRGNRSGGRYPARSRAGPLFQEALLKARQSSHPSRTILYDEIRNQIKLRREGMGQAPKNTRIQAGDLVVSNNARYGGHRDESSK